MCFLSTESNNFIYMFSEFKKEKVHSCQKHIDDEILIKPKRGFNYEQIQIHKNQQNMFVVEFTVFEDKRGYFMETYQENNFKDEGYDLKFVQDNQSQLTKGVLRGLHFQVNYPQGKLVRVIREEVFDVGVDLRGDSKTYGE